MDAKFSKDVDLKQHKLKQQLVEHLRSDGDSRPQVCTLRYIAKVAGRKIDRKDKQTPRCE